MIVSLNGTVKVDGKDAEILSDLTIAIKRIYMALEEKCGKDAALEQIAEVGRLAVMDSDEIREYAKQRIDELMNNMDK